MEAILLAGGLGNRLHKITGDLYPKSLAKVDGKPLIHYLVNYLKSMGVNRFIFAVSHHAQMIIESIQGTFPDLDVSFSTEQRPLGTGGAIKQALELVHAQQALVLNADSFMEFSIADFLEFSKQHNSSLSIICTQVPDVSRFGAADISDNGVLNKLFEKGQQGAGHINSGVYLINKNHPQLNAFSGKFSFESKLLSNQHVQVFAMKNQGVFFDIGTPDDFLRAQMLLKAYKLAVKTN